MQQSVATKSKCHEDGFAKDGVEVMLQKTMLKTMWQKTLLKCCYRKRC
jgi:hypothetical protein